MEIVRQTDTQLVIRHEPWAAWLLTSFAALMGVLVTAYGTLERQPLVFVLGLVLIVVPPILVGIRARVVTATFDKQADEVIVLRRGLMGSERVTVQIRDVVEVDFSEFRSRLPRTVVERWLPKLTHQCYVVRLVLNSGRTLSLIGMRSGEMSHHSQLASVMRSFLGLRASGELRVATNQ
ncbi:MAG: hypothetical protein OEO20_10830 [Gemmatimonadota bacterium]|nr:hypothetical protein [Gemmatimonadota bacterium]MDH3478786.1 hypothetical protein [Gemmatimonadota bacterium]MDH3571049.1 hypothetical protein [Gemmatimonadota bacterium]MDH5548311.1 hypothetical protein [Gemmatimonadota bacterium]